MTWLYTWITQTEDGWMERERGAPNMDFVDGYLLGVAMVLRSEGGAVVWPKLRPFLDEAFIQALEIVVGDDDTTYLDLLLGDLSLDQQTQRPSFGSLTE